MKHELAIIIPAYKPDFLKEAVQSILHQTDKRFQLYIFDDASLHNLEKVLEEELRSGLVRFHRFEDNLGGVSLVRQWNRCIEQTDEPWIWLFSDDDRMDPGCVKAFYEMRESDPACTAVRFATRKIDEQGDVLRINTFPDPLTAGDFLNLKLSYRQESYIVETIFSRHIFHQAGGIPDLPKAWAADDLFAAKLSFQGKTRVIHEPAVDWRYSSVNISGSGRTGDEELKMQAARSLINWIYNYDSLRKLLSPSHLPLLWYARQVAGQMKSHSFRAQAREISKASGHSRKIWWYYLRQKLRMKGIRW